MWKRFELTVMVVSFFAASFLPVLVAYFLMPYGAWCNWNSIISYCGMIIDILFWFGFFWIGDKFRDRHEEEARRKRYSEYLRSKENIR